MKKKHPNNLGTNSTPNFNQQQFNQSQFNTSQAQPQSPNYERNFPQGYEDFNPNQPINNYTEFEQRNQAIINNLPAERQLTRNSRRSSFSNPKARRKRKKFTPIGIALNVVIAVLIVVGAYLVCRPLVHQWNRDRKTQELLQDLTAKANAAAPNSTEDIVSTLWVDPNANPINGEGYDLPPGVEADGITIEEKKNEKGLVCVQGIGRMFINKINLDLPIVKGATDTPLKYGAGWYDYSSPIGEIGGNAVILAHRMLTYGRMFNRLDEVKNGDIVEIHSNNKVYKYKVYDSFSVDPSTQDMYEYFKPLENKRTIVTLVTCSKDDGRTRLMVRGELVQE